MNEYLFKIKNMITLIKVYQHSLLNERNFYFLKYVFLIFQYILNLKSEIGFINNEYDILFNLSK